ncbi:hypothetical protein PsYK624_125740 [Phanerochaete sordida]|uniref:Uncharacterized protein n=1 Tax=Phanerochaete sordida TaxID=48140 RepID=A0A9P3GI54_9APHY|nr:hypothetical protein PsYK624_125740 [Phanerochaete sordida]
MKFTTALAALALSAASTLVRAAPLQAARDVWDPTVTFPTTGSVLVSGQTYTVTWETADQPAHITNPNGVITLNFGDFGSPLILAKDFDIRDGHADITVPEVYTLSDFSITLWGDSGNWSGQFEIQGYSP